jgi:hypothetical protein
MVVRPVPVRLWVVGLISRSGITFQIGDSNHRFVSIAPTSEKNKPLTMVKSWEGVKFKGGEHDAGIKGDRRKAGRQAIADGEVACV